MPVNAVAPPEFLPKIALGKVMKENHSKSKFIMNDKLRNQKKRRRRKKSILWPQPNLELMLIVSA